MVSQTLIFLKNTLKKSFVKFFVRNSYNTLFYLTFFKANTHFNITRVT